MIASLSLDLDNQWSYMKTRGDAGWEDYPSYLDLVVPRILAFLRERDLRITFFVIGQDAALEKNQDAIKAIAEAGHEIANHSFRHEPWLHLYSRDELVAEFEKTEDALEALTGHRPIGFRGPGYSLSPTVIEVLAERGYDYDCSLLPTYVAPLARAFYFLRSPGMSAGERERLKRLYGKVSDGFRTLHPSFVEAAGRRLVEIPVTTFPVAKTPVHATYLIYLASYSPALARGYWKTAMAACRATKTEPSFLLHPLDFLGGEDVSELKFFPGMNMTAPKKIEFLDGVIADLTKHFEVVDMVQHSKIARQALEAEAERMQLEKV
jgi:peptidoglycan-N-acetylglucosamine deacetylase